MQVFVFAESHYLYMVWTVNLNQIVCFSTQKKYALHLRMV